MFKDRADAGKKLATELKKLKLSNVVVFGVPRGGVVPAAEVARSLKAPLSVVVARKIGSPGNAEFAIGAVSENGVLILNQAQFGDYLRKVAEEKKKEVEARVRMFRDGKPIPSLAGKTAVIVDDGIATGASIRAAILAVKKMNPARVILAVPVAPPESVAEISKECEVVCLVQDPAFEAVGEYYNDFREVTDEEAVSILKRFQKK